LVGNQLMDLMKY